MMTTSQQRRLVLLTAALALVLLVGSAEALTCTKPYADCDKDGYSCETNLYTNVTNCGKCRYKCPVTYKNGVAYCSNGVCYMKCKPNYCYSSKYKYCVPC